MKSASGIPYWPSRDPIGENGGVNLYGFVGNDGIDSYDVLGRWWLFPSHAELTQKAWDELGLSYPRCNQISAQVISANKSTDELGSTYSANLAYHYNRKVGQNVAEAKVEYGLLRIKMRLDLIKFQFKDSATRGECSSYIETYGRLTHTSQDYYGHAVANAAVDYNSDVGVLNGSPDDPSPDFKPSSYAGIVGKDEHGSPPRDHEPGTRNGQQATRTRQAIDFVKKDMKIYMDAYYSKCQCYCLSL